MKPQESYPIDERQIRQLKSLVSRGEGLNLEFKRKAAFPEKIVREMIAFANTKGGLLLLGIGDDGSIPGLKHPDEESHVIQKALLHCKPQLPVRETFIPIGGNRSVIQYEIRESKTKPHYFVFSTETKESYVRVDDKSIKASREMREIARRSQRAKDIRFHYGEYEQMLMKYLDKHHSITLNEFIELSGLKRLIASKKLVLLVLADVLHIRPHERGDIFSLTIINDEEKKISLHR
jgi:predicted HTH transcriptional regulator